jgi:hypothetical protein
MAPRAFTPTVRGFASHPIAKTRETADWDTYRKAADAAAAIEAELAKVAAAGRARAASGLRAYRGARGARGAGRRGPAALEFLKSTALLTHFLEKYHALVEAEARRHPGMDLEEDLAEVCARLGGADPDSPAAWGDPARLCRTCAARAATLSGGVDETAVTLGERGWLRRIRAHDRGPPRG